MYSCMKRRRVVTGGSNQPRVMVDQAKGPSHYQRWTIVVQDVKLIELLLLLLQDLNRLGRDLRKVVIIDNSPQSYIFHPDNAVSGITHTSTSRIQAPLISHYHKLRIYWIHSTRVLSHFTYGVLSHSMLRFHSHFTYWVLLHSMLRFHSHFTQNQFHSILGFHSDFAYWVHSYSTY